MNKWFNRRIIAVALMGFASGLPIALVGGTLQAWFTDANASLLTVGSLTLLGQPYLYKFIWAPVMDRWVPPLLGRRRGWIILMQVCLCLALFYLSFLNPIDHAMLMYSVALLIAFLSASQDIAIDAYRTDILEEKERGIGSAAVGGFYRIAVVISGGFALILAGSLGWSTTYSLMACLILLGCIVTWCSPHEKTEVIPRTIQDAVIEPFKDFLTRPAALLILAFIVLYKFGDAFALSLMTPFLMKGVGFSLAEVGSVNKIMGIGASMFGIFLGGILLTRISLYRALWCFGILQAVSNLMFLFLALFGKSLYFLALAVGVENICGGLGTVAFLAFLMSLCNHRYSATQYALFSAMFSIGRVVIGPFAAVFVEHYGWIEFFISSIWLSVPGLALLWYLKRQPLFELKGQSDVATSEA